MCDTGRIEAWLELVNNIEDYDMDMIKYVYHVYKVYEMLRTMSTPVLWYSYG
jgi:hypothetical protein